jgi:hypothetical protein
MARRSVGGHAAAYLALAIACAPRVQLEAPREPIVIHLNVKIEQEVRVRVDRELDQLIAEDEDLFGTGEKP